MPHARALDRTAHRLAGSVDDASVAQETFLRAYRTFDNFQAGTNEKAWLFTIPYSIMSNRWQSTRRAPVKVGIDDLDARFEAAAAALPANGEQALLERLGATPEILRALDALPEPYRAAVLLVDVEGLSYEEAAVALACPDGVRRVRRSGYGCPVFASTKPTGQVSDAGHIGSLGQRRLMNDALPSPSAK
jgi:RNA polymerase sigma-70 factor, ECF subfamily